MRTGWFKLRLCAIGVVLAVAFATVGSPGQGLVSTACTALAATTPALCRSILASVGPGRIPGNDRSIGASVSADGRFVAFSSYARNLVLGDTNGVPDVFLHDTLLSSTTRISVSPIGLQGNRPSQAPTISPDGRFVVYESTATNLVPGDSNGVGDAFLYDRATMLTSRVSIATGGAQASADSGDPGLSPDGRFVTFRSFASDLVPGDTNGHIDVFLRDRVTGTTTRESVASGGGQADSVSFPATMSPDGRYVAFSSFATNLVPDDTNGMSDVFVRDRQTDVTKRLSVTSAGTQGNGQSYGGAVTADGRFVAFASYATNLDPGVTDPRPDIFVHDAVTSELTHITRNASGQESDGQSTYTPTITPDGRYILITSNASNLVPGVTWHWDTTYVHDRTTGTMELVSVAADGGVASGETHGFSISPDGRFVGMTSTASNLVLVDLNGYVSDVFVRDRRVR